MKDEQNTILDDLLSRWHSWNASYELTSTPSTSPMFRQAKSSRGWDSASEIIHDEAESATMERVDFVICGMQEPHRSAVYAHARNLCTGKKVWSSQRVSTEDLGIRAYSKLIDRVQAFAATDLNVSFPASFDQWEAALARGDVDPDTGEILG